MARAISAGETFPYILKADRDLPDDAPDKTVWMLRILSATELAEVQDAIASVNDAGNVAIHQGTSIISILERGLDSVEKFPDKNGNPIELEKIGSGKKSAGVQRMLVKRSSIDRIHPSDRRELSEAITEQQTLTEAEKGN